MNLCTEPWLTFKTVDDEQVELPLKNIGREDLVDIVMPRQDFYGASWQFLIGILQTAFAPEDDSEWLEHYESPPTSADLESALNKISHAFELLGEGPRFMQDLSPLSDSSTVSVSSLLIDAPGGNALKLNTDHFVKRGNVNQLSLPMAAMALFTLQINAPAGGQGHRTGLRGGGPLTTLAVSSDPSLSLFRKLWLNILTFEGSDLSPPSHFKDGAVFPWLAPTRVSDKKGSEIYLHDEGMHPLHHYWAMPRRIRLEDAAAGQCDLLGVDSTRLVTHYRTQNYGANYSGAWKHPLTPYRFDPKKPENEPFSIKGQPGGIGYRQWHQFLFRNQNEGVIPAQVIENLGAKEVWLEDLGLIDNIGIWVFGFDMDNMKARSWYESRMPFLPLSPEKAQRYSIELTLHVEAAKTAGAALRRACKDAWFGNGDTRGDLRFIDDRFWSETERAFFRLAYAFKNSMQAGDDKISSQTCQTWITELQNAVLTIFDDLVLSVDSHDPHLRRKIEARRNLKFIKYKGDYLKRYQLDTKRKVAS
jgi:CRISPR system Cascade subunit CasA